MISCLPLGLQISALDPPPSPPEAPHRSLILGSTSSLQIHREVFIATCDSLAVVPAALLWLEMSFICPLSAPLLGKMSRLVDNPRNFCM